MNTSRLASVILGLGLALSVTQGHAVVLLSDSFDADSSTTQLDFNGFINWTVDGGTVDYLREGNTFGIDCVGTSGGCVDSDGSSNDAGRLLSKQAFFLPTGTSGTLSLMVSGNQRGGASDILNLGFVDATSLAPLGSVPCLRDAFDPYSSCSGEFFAFAPFNVRVIIEGTGNDSVGAVFDDFLLIADIAQAPEPATLALFGIALAGLGCSRRKRA